MSAPPPPPHTCDSGVVRPTAGGKELVTLLGKRHSHHLLHRVLEEHSDSGQVTPGRHRWSSNRILFCRGSRGWFSAMDREEWRAEP